MKLLNRLSLKVLTLTLVVLGFAPIVWSAPIVGEMNVVLGGNLTLNDDSQSARYLDVNESAVTGGTGDFSNFFMPTDAGLYDGTEQYTSVNILDNFGADNRISFENSFLILDSHILSLDGSIPRTIS